MATFPASVGPSLNSGRPGTTDVGYGLPCVNAWRCPNGEVLEIKPGAFPRWRGERESKHVTLLR